MYNGYVMINSVPDTHSLTYLLPGQATAPPAPSYDVAVLSIAFHALSSTAGYGGRIYGNRIVGVLVGGPYHDLTGGETIPEKDILVWNNYHYFVAVGPFSAIAKAVAPLNYHQLWNWAHDNIVDLQPFPKENWNQAAPGGLVFWGPYPVKDSNGNDNPQFPGLNTVIVHDNVVRFVDWNQGTVKVGGNGYTQYGIDFMSAQYVVVEDNLITFSSDRFPPLSYDEVDLSSFHARNNLSTDGTLLTPGSRGRPLT